MLQADKTVNQKGRSQGNVGYVVGDVCCTVPEAARQGPSGEPWGAGSSQMPRKGFLFYILLSVPPDVKLKRDLVQA